jgi:hypothetical protein
MRPHRSIVAAVACSTVQRPLIAIPEHDARARPQHPVGRRHADTAGTAGDDRHAPLEIDLVQVSLSPALLR